MGVVTLSVAAFLGVMALMFGIGVATGAGAATLLDS